LHVTGHRDRRIAAIASLQRGMVSRQQLLAAGIGRGAISRMLASGWLLPEHQGVYSVAYRSKQPFARETAAVLAIGADAVLSHRSAALVWGMCPARSGAPVEVLVPAGSAHRRDGIVAHRTKRLERRETRIREGLPVTSPARTALDIAADVSLRELERAVDEALVGRLVRYSELRAAASQAKGRRGGPLLSAVLDHRGAPTITRSEAEERFLELVRDAGLPEPEVNVHLNGYEVDFFWREQNVVVEVDGYTYHATRGAFERDRAKDATMIAAGIQVMRITWLQMERERLAVVVRVAQTLARRS
jgi:very-short-patch-repair endonuclease